MRFYVTTSWCNWEIGLGFCIGKWFLNQLSRRYTRPASEIYLLIGPFSFGLCFGAEIELSTSETRRILEGGKL